MFWTFAAAEMEDSSCNINNNFIRLQVESGKNLDSWQTKLITQKVLTFLEIYNLK